MSRHRFPCPRRQDGDREEHYSIPRRHRQRLRADNTEGHESAKAEDDVSEGMCWRHLSCRNERRPYSAWPNRSCSECTERLRSPQSPRPTEGLDEATVQALFGTESMPALLYSCLPPGTATTVIALCIRATSVWPGRIWTPLIATGRGANLVLRSHRFGLGALVPSCCRHGSRCRWRPRRILLHIPPPPANDFEADNTEGHDAKAEDDVSEVPG